MLGQQGAGISGFGNALQQMGYQQVQPPKDATALEVHLSVLHKLHETTTGALGRATSIADRLLGCEPQPPTKGIDGAVINSSPSLLQKLDDTARSIAHLVDALHSQINRLDRI